MKTKTLLSTLLMLLAIFSLQAQGLSQLTEYKLDNGLTVILNPDHTKPEVFGYVVCKAGGKDDPSDATGMAHYMEHMLFKGTEQLGTTDWDKEKVHIDSIFVLYDELGATNDETKRAEIQLKINEQSVASNTYAIPNELSKLIKQTGGTGMNANTSADRTVFFNTFPPSQIESWIEIYSHRFQNAVFRSFQAELEVVYEEKNMYSDQFIMNIMEKLRADFFKNHPYGQQTLLGTIEDLKSPSLTKMKEFYKTWYVPNNMALVLSGDFDTEMIKPLIAKTFGKWEYKAVPERKTWEEVPFDGRELTEVKMSPIKLGFLAYRTVPEGHPDELALQICNGILSNESQSGLLDQLMLNKEVLAVQAFSFPYYDYGLGAFLLVPKIVGQSLEEAEQLALGKLQLLKDGDFEDWRVEAIKLELYRQHMTSLESNRGRGIIIGETFAQGHKISELKEYPELIKSVTKEDIIAVANKYYGDNYLAFFSKMGSPDAAKIEKPGYKAVVSNTTAKSEFTQHLEQIGSSNYTPKYLDFDHDITKTNLAPNANLYVTNNPQNDIFTLKIKYNVGSDKLPQLKEAFGLMGDAYTDTFSKSELKNEFAKLGASYGFFVDKSYSGISITGLEDNLDGILALVNSLLVNPKLDQGDVSALADDEVASRKMEREDIAGVSQAAYSWVCYGKGSDYLKRLTLKEMKDLQADTLLSSFHKASHYAVELHYTGKKTSAEVENSIAQQLEINTNLKDGVGSIEPTLMNYDKNTVYFVNKKKASQAKLYFFANEKGHTTSDIPAKEAFNLYFGGGFTGLVLQEIREYRSLAYGAGANFKHSKNENTPSFFSGYIGTQADKTAEALEVFHNLVDSMPHKTERIEMIRPYLEQSAFTDHPDFRGLSEYIVKLSYKGINEDPAKLFNEAYKNLTFEDIVTFYEENLQNAPMVTLVVGDKKNIDMDALKKYGKIVTIKEKDLFSK